MAKRQFNLGLKAEMYDKLVELATDYGMTVGQLIRFILAYYLRSNVQTVFHPDNAQF